MSMMTTTLKRLAFYISLAVLSIVIVACNGGGDGGGNSNNNGTNSPESVARSVFSAIVKFDLEAIAPHVCPERRAEFQQQFDALAPMLQEQAATIAQVDVDISNVTFNVQNQTDTTAEVRVSGEATVSDGENVITQEINATDYQPLQLVKVDNTWYICSDILPQF